jgi:hypothetical protein
VDNLLVYAGAERRRESVEALERRRRSFVATDPFLGPAIEIGGAHPGANHAGNLVEHVGDNLASVRDDLDLFVGLQRDHERPTTLSSSSYTASTEPTAASLRKTGVFPYQRSSGSVCSW